MHDFFGRLGVMCVVMAIPACSLFSEKPPEPTTAELCPAIDITDIDLTQSGWRVDGKYVQFCLFPDNCIVMSEDAKEALDAARLGE